MISIKTPLELNAMKILGAKTDCIVSKLIEFTKAGVSTKQIEDLALSLFDTYGLSSAFYGYSGFPGQLCISVNEELIHGIPSASKIICDGDIVSIDCGLFDNGLYSDMARSFAVGSIDELKTDLLHVGYEALLRGMNAVRPGAAVGDIGYAVQSYVEECGFCVVKKFVGHGVGRDLHEEPEIPNFGVKGQGPRLRAGMTLAIEPMITVDSDDVYVDRDDWTVIAKDKKPCVHFENTIAVTVNGYEILTMMESNG